MVPSSPRRDSSSQSHFRGLAWSAGAGRGRGGEPRLTRRSHDLLLLTRAGRGEVPRELEQRRVLHESISNRRNEVRLRGGWEAVTLHSRFLSPHPFLHH